MLAWGKAIFGTDEKRSFWDTLVSARVEELQQRGLIGSVGARNHNSLMPRAQTLIKLDVFISVTHDIFIISLALCVNAGSAMLDLVTTADHLLLPAAWTKNGKDLVMENVSEEV